MRIVANPDLCVGAGQCVLTDPTLFDQDDDGVVLVLVEQAEGVSARSAREAVALCPSQALSVEE